MAICALLLAPSPHHKYGLTEAMPRIDGTIRLCSYNVLNLFDHKDDITLQGEYDDIGDNPGPTSTARCEELAKAIRAVNADILALQEVESEEALRWFNDTFLKGMGYDHLVSKEVGYYRGIEQSILSRFPITDVQIWPEEDLANIKRKGINWTPAPPDTKELKFQRSPLCVTVEASDSYSLTLFILHHKAGRNNNWHRESEALQTMTFVKEMIKNDPNRNIAVLGDFNAAPYDKSVKVYYRGGMTDTMAHRSTKVDYDLDAPLFKTHTTNRIIDFILLNPAGMGEFVPNSGFILGSSAEEYDWRNDKIPSGYASDHYPLSIALVPTACMGVSVTANPWPETSFAKASKPAEPENTVPVEDANFIASKRSEVFHNASCSNANRIKESNKVGYESHGDASGSGRRPAGCCKPTS